MTFSVKYVSKEPIYFEIEAKSTIDALKRALLMMQVENSRDNFVLSCVSKQNSECVFAGRLS